MKKENISIQCSDGFLLQGTLYFVKSEVKAAIMIAPATGIKRRFYTHFASYLAEQGFGVLTFDNRGIGDSLHGSVVSSEADLVQWGTYDMPAVLEQLKACFSGVPYYLVGHSAGGQLIGLMHNHSDLSAVFNVAASSGSLRNIKGLFWIKARFFMSILIPITNLLMGYTPAGWVGMGESLPRGVAAQWSSWCHGSHYVKMGFGKEIKAHWFDEMRLPMKWLFAIDDEIAILPNVEEMISVFPNTKSEKLKIVPQDHGLKEVGHMKFFSRASQKLWSSVTSFFEENSIKELENISESS